MDNHTPIYCFSGLGADSRIFQKLQLHNTAIKYIRWQMPAPEDDMRSFAIALARQIEEPEVILLGVSFGGMLATTITALALENKMPFRVKRTIIISSCKTRNELPAYLRLAGKARLHKIVPYQWATRYSFVNRLVFDTRSKAEEMLLKSVMLKSTDFTFLKRAVHMILTWQQHQPPAGIFHIHGSSDRLLLPGRIKPDAWVKGGGHFIIWNEAEQVSRLISEAIEDAIYQ
jgi:pimeloyl-ACP methyl ester carboxylesterase